MIARLVSLMVGLAVICAPVSVLAVSIPGHDVVVDTTGDGNYNKTLQQAIDDGDLGGGGTGPGDITAVGVCTSGDCFQNEGLNEFFATPLAGGPADFRTIVPSDLGTAFVDQLSDFGQLCSPLEILQRNAGGTAWQCITAPTQVAPANPTALVGIAPVNGSALTYMRSDAAPAIDPTVVQRRVSGICVAGSAIREINQDGTVLCQAAGGGAGGGYDSITTDSGTVVKTEDEDLAILGGADITVSAVDGGPGNVRDDLTVTADATLARDTEVAAAIDAQVYCHTDDCQIDLLGDVITGVQSDACARFNAAGVLVASAGDCPSGDTNSPPGGGSGELQVNDGAGGFTSLSGSSVSGSNLSLPGNLSVAGTLDIAPKADFGGGLSLKTATNAPSGQEDWQIKVLDSPAGVGGGLVPNGSDTGGSYDATVHVCNLHESGRIPEACLAVTGGGGGGTNVQINTGGNLAAADFRDTAQITLNEAAGAVTLDITDGGVDLVHLNGACPGPNQIVEYGAAGAAACIATPAGGGGNGDTVFVKGFDVVDPNFNETDPATEDQHAGVKFEIAGVGPNVSAQVPISGQGSTNPAYDVIIDARDYATASDFLDAYWLALAPIIAAPTCVDLQNNLPWKISVVGEIDMNRDDLQPMGDDVLVGMGLFRSGAYSAGRPTAIAQGCGINPRGALELNFDLLVRYSDSGATNPQRQQVIFQTGNGYASGNLSSTQGGGLWGAQVTGNLIIEKVNKSDAGWPVHKVSGLWPDVLGGEFASPTTTYGWMSATDYQMHFENFRFHMHYTGAGADIDDWAHFSYMSFENSKDFIEANAVNCIFLGPASQGTFRDAECKGNNAAPFGIVIGSPLNRTEPADLDGCAGTCAQRYVAGTGSVFSGLITAQQYTAANFTSFNSRRARLSIWNENGAGFEHTLYSQAVGAGICCDPDAGAGDPARCDDAGDFLGTAGTDGETCVLDVDCSGAASCVRVSDEGTGVSEGRTQALILEGTHDPNWGFGPTFWTNETGLRLTDQMEDGAALRGHTQQWQGNFGRGETLPAIHPEANAPLDVTELITDRVAAWDPDYTGVFLPAQTILYPPSGTACTALRGVLNQICIDDTSIWLAQPDPANANWETAGAGDWRDIGGAGGSGEPSDGNKGDITVTNNGLTWAINADAVGTNQLSDSAVTEAKLGGASVTSVKIFPQAVNEAALDTNAVTTNKIQDGAVTPAKISGFTDEKCAHIQDVAEANTFLRVHRTSVNVTLTEVWCTVDSGTTTTVNLLKNGGPGMLASNLVCTVAGATSSVFSDANYDDGDTIDIDLITPDAAEGVTVCWEYTRD